MKEIKLIKQKENPLFDRKEIEIEVHADSAPQKKETFEFLAKKFSAPAENIRIKKISGKFGTNNFFITAHIYKNKNSKFAVEFYSKKQKEKEEKMFSQKEIKEEAAQA